MTSWEDGGFMFTYKYMYDILRIETDQETPPDLNLYNLKSGIILTAI